MTTSDQPSSDHDDDPTENSTDDYDYDRLYSAEDREDSPPWDIGRPQPALAELFDGATDLGTVLDAGCGTGDLSVFLATRADQVVGFDLSAPAIARARRRAAERGLDNATFVVADATDLEALDVVADVVVDSGLLHSLDDVEQRAYLAQLSSVVVWGSRLYVLAVLQDAGEGWGVTREGLDEVVTAHGWTVDAVDPADVYAKMGDQQFQLPSFLLSARRAGPAAA